MEIQVKRQVCSSSSLAFSNFSSFPFKSSSFIQTNPNVSPQVPRRNCIKAKIAEPNKALSPQIPQPLPTPVVRLPPLSFLIDAVTKTFRYKELSKTYGPVYRAPYLNKEVTVVSDLMGIIEVLSDSETYANSGGAFPVSVEHILGKEVVLLIDGKKHARDRRKLLPIFAKGMLRNYFAPSKEVAKETMEIIAKLVAKKGRAAMRETLQEHFLKVIIKVTTGLKTNVLSPEEISWCSELFGRYEIGFFSPPWGPIFGRAMAAKKKLMKKYEGIITKRLIEEAEEIEDIRRALNDSEKRKTPLNLQKEGLDMLTLAIAQSPLKTGFGQKHDPATVLEISESMVYMWFAGSSTQVSSALLCIFQMALHEEYYKPLLEEQNEIVRRTGSTELTLEQVSNEMPLLESFMTEVLRVYPAGTLMRRRVTKDTMLMGHLIKKGSIVATDNWTAQTDEKYFKDAKVLKMDRFVGRTDRHTKLVVFGPHGGPHFCLGFFLAEMNIKTLMATLLREYDFELDKKQSRRLISIPTIEPATGVTVVKCEKKNAVI